MVAFYKHNIASWRGGTASLTDPQYRLYHVIVEQIYFEEGPITLHVRAIAGLCNMSTRMVRLTFAELVNLGKLSVGLDGKISQVRAEFELKNVTNNRRNAAKGGRTPRELNKNLNKNNEESRAPLQHDRSLREKRREEIDSESTSPLNPSLPSEPSDTVRSSDDDRAIKFQKEAGAGIAKPAKPNGHHPPDGWEAFWAACPRKRAKAAALRAYKAAIKKAAPATILAGLERHKPYWARRADPRFTPHPASWLNGECWNDDLSDTPTEGVLV